MCVHASAPRSGFSQPAYVTGQCEPLAARDFCSRRQLATADLCSVQCTYIPSRRVPSATRPDTTSGYGAEALTAVSGAQYAEYPTTTAQFGSGTMANWGVSEHAPLCRGGQSGRRSVWGGGQSVPVGRWPVGPTPPVA